MKSEIYQDINENCDIILNLLKSFEAENDTPEGRMIYQCRWLKEQVEANSLSLPTQDYIHTLRYVLAEQLLHHLASSEENYQKEIGVYLYRLAKSIKNKLLLKLEYYPYALRIIDALVFLLNNASRELDKYEKGLIGELERLQYLLTSGEIEPPLMSYMPDYPNFIEVEGIQRITIDDLPDGKVLYRTVANLIFEGIRPDSWLTPEDADRETKKYTTDFDD
ncbi:MAG: hypothetical protein OEZ39_14770 [Gammaproteobacteria bacterium]|nr:hypothetical protein [Gammaproteobacteria bacterium]